MRVVALSIMAILFLIPVLCLLFLLREISLKESSRHEICYNGFTYARMDRSYSPVFNMYGMPKRCKTDK